MTNLQSRISPLDDPVLSDFITRLITAGETNASIARQVSRGWGIETSRDSIRRFRQRHSLNLPGTEPAYTKIHGDEAECLCSPTTEAKSDPDRMLGQRGLDSKEWYIDSITVNEWEGLQKGGANKTTLYQTKFTAKRKKPFNGLMPPRSDGWQPITMPPTLAFDEPQLVAVCGDQHAPYHDENLHRLYCKFLSELKPARGVVLGDLGDFPDISRHPADPENHCKAQESLQASYNILADYKYASPQTTWDYLIGNHDERIRQYMIKNAPLLYPFHQVDTPDGRGAEIHSMAYLMRLDELGVRLVDPQGTYEYAQVDLSSNLAVRHGWVVRQGSGTSALKTLEQTGYSVIVGHTHRQSCVYHTMQEIDGTPRQTLAVETGCMCRMDKRSGKHQQPGERFPNYMVHPDWQQGFATATIFPDGKFKVDLGTYVNGVLLWRDRRYE